MYNNILYKEIYESQILNQQINYYILETKYDNQKTILNESDDTSGLGKIKKFIKEKIDRLVEIVQGAIKKIRHFFFEYIPSKFKDLKDKIMKRNKEDKENNNQPSKEVEKVSIPLSHSDNDKSDKKIPNDNKDKDSEKVNISSANQFKEFINFDKLYDLYCTYRGDHADMIHKNIMASDIHIDKFNSKSDISNKYDKLNEEYERLKNSKNEDFHKKIKEMNSQIDSVVSSNKMHMSNNDILKKFEIFYSSIKKITIVDDIEQEINKQINPIRTLTMKCLGTENDKDVLDNLNKVLSIYSKILNLEIEMQNEYFSVLNKIYTILYNWFSKTLLKDALDKSIKTMEEKKKNNEEKAINKNINRIESDSKNDLKYTVYAILARPPKVTTAMRYYNAIKKVDGFYQSYDPGKCPIEKDKNAWSKSYYSSQVNSIVDNLCSERFLHCIEVAKYLKMIS